MWSNKPFALAAVHCTSRDCTSWWLYVLVVQQHGALLAFQQLAAKETPTACCEVL